MAGLNKLQLQVFSRQLSAIPTQFLELYMRGDFTVYDDCGNHSPVATAIGYGDGIYNLKDFQSIQFDNNDKISIPDSDSLSFGNGTTDVPFSFTVVVYMDENPVQASRIFQKRSTVNLTDDREYEFALAGAANIGKPQMVFYDQSTGGFIGVRSDVVVAPNTPTVLQFIYDGTGLASGMKIKMNDVFVTTTNISTGTYVAMESLSAPVTIGIRPDSDVQQFRGRMESISLWKIELRDKDTENIYNLLSSGSKLEYLKTPNNVAPRQFRYWSGNPLFEWVIGDQFRDPSRIIEMNGFFYFYASKFDEAQPAKDFSEEIAVFRSSTYNGNYTYEGVVLTIAATGLDDRCIFTPDVIVVDGTIYMYYTGAGTTNSERWNIFLASSTDPEGTFVRVDTDPILYNSIDGSGVVQENFRLDAATPVIMEGGSIRLYYKMVSGSAGSGVTGRYFGYADGTFPDAWVKSLDNPFFSSADNPDGLDPETPDVFFQNGKYWMFYVVASTDTKIWFMSSPDGVNDWVAEYDIEETDIPTPSLTLHATTPYFKNGNLVAILFHGGPADNFDVRRFELLTYF